MKKHSSNPLCLKIKSKLSLILFLSNPLILFIFFSKQETKEVQVSNNATSIQNSNLPEYSDPLIPSLSGAFVDDSGYDLAYGHSAPITDRTNLALCYESAMSRYQNATTNYLNQLRLLNQNLRTGREFQFQRAMLQLRIGLVQMYAGKFLEADQYFASAIHDNPLIAVELKTNLTGLRGVAALRRGELDNCVACVGPSSCIYPIATEARHQNRDGSENALRFFDEYLEKRADVGIKWLSHIAQRTLGSIKKNDIQFNEDWNSRRNGIHSFKNQLQELGLGTRGPNMLGGSFIGDLNGDRLPDIAISSGDWDMGISIFRQNPDSTFTDVAAESKLEMQRMAANLTGADYDNDGDMDLLLLRGGWESPYRMTLLKNRGDLKYTDVIEDAGLAAPIASQSAAWADYDRDGDLDLYVAGEFHDRNATPLNYNRLYENQGDGRFIDVAEKAGVINQSWAKGVVWGDFDNDNFPDLFVSNMNGFNRLYRNNGDKTFTDIAAEAGVIEPVRSFSCWFWDYNDDGLQDIFVAGFSATLNEIVQSMSGKMPEKAEIPRLYQNLGNGKFENVTEQAGLAIVTVPMGSNYGDYNNDGRLDIYLATGRPSYSMLIPNLMFHNEGGKKFRNTTVETGTGHLQKGHGVSFDDIDLDGDLDLFVQTGGQSPADKSHNVMFINEMKPTNSCILHLQGTKSNRSAIGAKLKAIFQDSTGLKRTIFRTVSSGSSFGGNSLDVHIGLAGALRIDSLEIQWPSGQQQSFTNLKANQFIEIKEGSHVFESRNLKVKESN